ncbi:coniferyl aldehyde dehydrogenase [Hyphomonas pacifica]|uniref:coniferyl aldehyde dehydrogenase n=1 Tax=Hyphomonas pacifica TaxID=1280941 RepID=UPI000DC01291|nr:coniferyl aldehyde dehydrogenase [Hyphomonas pacifica]RAN38393.1 coniferyl aldehyde dehydrogenase [Hyphomonas pacifica]
MALDSASGSGMSTILAKQKAAHIRDGIPSAVKRIEWLDRSIDLLVTHGEALSEAMRDDFGHRSMDQSALTDIAGSIGALKFAKKNVAKWMRPEKRKAEFPLGLLGSKSEIRYQPKGVIGVISPWNFPVNLTFAPLAGVFAAGNRTMIKPSEFTEATSELMKKLLAQYYDEEEVAVITGGPEVGAEFTKLAFDHIIFTGATSIAHHVMRAAADNLVPLTLELGGKSPVILGRSADIQKAANRIMAGKTLNAGQICLAPDYAFVPQEKKAEFVSAATKAIETMYPTGLKDNADYTSVVNQRHYDRIMSYIEEARDKGAEVIELNPTGENFSQQPHHKIPPHIIVDPSEDLKVMQDEIFGPVLPIKSYGETKDAVAYINGHPRPLGLYYFGEDPAEKDFVLNNTTSGGVTVNDVIFHVAQEDLPFGGVGPSGMGSYHGREGFYEFSHKKSVYTQTGSEMLAMMRPPYTDKFRKQVQGRVKR